MLRRLAAARLLLPGLCTLGALAVLLSLGKWQLDRKAWKESIVAKIEQRVGAPAVDLVPFVTATHEEPDLEYTHVAVRGRYRHDKERYVYAPEKSGPGWHVLTPLVVGSGTVVWINRGFVPEALKAPEMRAEGLTAGEVRVTGLLREPRAAFFTPANDVARNIWYWADIPALTASAFGDEKVQPLWVVVDVDAADTPRGGWPRGGTTRLIIPNRHLEYAVTWFGLAATLVGVFLAFAWSRLREGGAERQSNH